jgi:hypothetical protein
MDKSIVFQATVTISNKLAWNFKDGIVQHKIDSSSKTLCGKNTRGGTSYGWTTKHDGKEVKECPVCQKMSEVISL